jgi:hypothetical protein
MMPLDQKCAQLRRKFSVWDTDNTRVENTYCITEWLDIMRLELKEYSKTRNGSIGTFNNYDNAEPTNRDRPARLDWPKSGIIGKLMVSTYLAISFEFFRFAVEYLKRVHFLKRLLPRTI